MGLIIACMIFIMIIIIGVCFMVEEDFRIFSTILMMFLVALGAAIGMELEDKTTPSIEDYIHGNVGTKVQQTIENGEVVKCDTIYYKL